MTRDRFLTEKVLGDCWHEFDYHYFKLGRSDFMYCKKCDMREDNAITNFSTPDGFFKLLESTVGMEKIVYALEIITYRDGDMYLSTHFGNGKKDFKSLKSMHDLPDTFADAIARYFKWEGGE